MSIGSWLSRAIGVAGEVRVADRLAAGPRVAERTGRRGRRTAPAAVSGPYRVNRYRWRDSVERHPWLLP